jgi:hypothetical protein
MSEYSCVRPACGKAIREQYPKYWYEPTGKRHGPFCTDDDCAGIDRRAWENANAKKTLARHR